MLARPPRVRTTPACTPVDLARPARHPLAGAALAALTLLAASIGTAALATALRLPTALVPLVFAAFAGVALVAFRRLPRVADDAPLRGWEWALIGWATLMQLVRAVPYTAQYVGGRLGAAVHYDDNWHFQELASLVNSERFPPLLNYQPDTHLHFYYVAWMPAAALAELLGLAGLSWLKIAYAVGTLLLAVAAAVILIVFLRHVLAPRQRGPGMAALLVAGAVPDGIALLVRWGAAVALPDAAAPDLLAHAEWWPRDLGIPIQISSLTTLLVWVPHHLIAAAALLLAVVIVTAPRTLAPRTLAPRGEVVAMAAAGLMVAFAAFSSVFVTLGAAVALAPLAARFVRRPLALVAPLVAAVVALPLAYLYLRADAAGGFQVLPIVSRWREVSDSVAVVVAAVVLPAAVVTAEIGWLAWLALRRTSTPRPGVLSSPLGGCAVAATAFVASTVVIGFSGANNYAMRGAIVPVMVIATHWAQARIAAVAPAAPDAAMRWRGGLGAAVMLIGALAAVTHLAEAARHTRDSLAAIAFAAETETCKAHIMAANAGPPGAVDPTAWGCRAPDSLYGLERPFMKRSLVEPDRELMGRGP